MLCRTIQLTLVPYSENETYIYISYPARRAVDSLHPNRLYDPHILGIAVMVPRAGESPLQRGEGYFGGTAAQHGRGGCDAV